MDINVTKSVCYLLGKGMRSMNSLPKRHSISDLVLDNNSITKIEKLDAFPKLCSVSLLIFDYCQQIFFCPNIFVYYVLFANYYNIYILISAVNGR